MSDDSGKCNLAHLIDKPRRRWTRWRLVVVIGALVAAVCLGLGQRYIKAGYDGLTIARRYGEFKVDEVPEGAVVAAFMAHPNDECFVFAGLLSRMIQERGAEVTLVSGDTERLDKFQAAADLLGARGVRTLTMGGDETTYWPHFDRQVARVLDELNPQVVVTFGPEGITGHPQHQAVALSVWRSTHRRGRGLLLRAVMAKEFDSFVTKDAAAPEPGWGVRPIQYVPLGETGAIRSKIADCYVSQREVVARDEWKANLVNTEFFAVTRFSGPANEPALHESASHPVIHADEALLIVHPTASWDLRLQSKPAIDQLVESIRSNGQPVLVLLNEAYPFAFLEARDGPVGFKSPGGEHSLRLDVGRLWLAGGSFEACLDRGLCSALRGMVKSGRKKLEVVVPTAAVYSVVFEDDHVGAVTLQDRLAKADDGGDALLSAFVRRVVGGKPIANYDPEGQSKSLQELLRGWEIALVLGNGNSRSVQSGDGDYRLTVRFR